MSEIIDRVAFAIFSVWHRESTKAAESYAGLSNDAKAVWRESALQAIEAMREPTEAMLEEDMSDDWYEPSFTPKIVWQRMIDEALR